MTRLLVALGMAIALTGCGERREPASSEELVIPALY